MREALLERETLWRIAPHIIWPLRFVLPHHKGLRPAWMLRLGLFLYDHLGARKLLPPTRTLRLRQDPGGRAAEAANTASASNIPTAGSRIRGSSCSTRATPPTAARRSRRARPACSARATDGVWRLTLRDELTGETYEISARALVNAAGPWVGDVIGAIAGVNARAAVRLVKGSHIVTERLFDHDRCYIFQNSDGRILFAIPYERDFTLIGTTDLDYSGDPGAVAASDEEIDYLCKAASDYFREPVTPNRSSGATRAFARSSTTAPRAAQAATRDYVLKIDAPAKRPALLNVFGGKITTYRRLAEVGDGDAGAASARAARGRARWTAKAPLPGGDFPVQGFETLVAELQARYPSLDPDFDRAGSRAPMARSFPRSSGALAAPADLGRASAPT